MVDLLPEPEDSGEQVNQEPHGTQQIAEFAGPTVRRWFPHRLLLSNTPPRCNRTGVSCSGAVLSGPRNKSSLKLHSCMKISRHFMLFFLRTIAEIFIS
jgi:hypothetical protein